MKKINLRERMKAFNVDFSNVTFCFYLICLSIMFNLVSYTLDEILAIASLIVTMASIILTTYAYFSYRNGIKRVINDAKKEVINNIQFKKADRLLRASKIKFNKFKSGHTFDSLNAMYICSLLLDCGFDKDKIKIEVYYKDITIDSFFNCLFCYENNQFELRELTPVSKENMANVIKDNKEAFLRAFGKEELIINV